MPAELSATDPIRVLIVDDEPSVRMLLRRWVERSMAAEVFEAEDGLQGLEAISAKPFEIVISDINMPVLDGIEMLRLLRTDPAHADLEILMVSHVTAEDKVREVIALGASDYLLKPLQFDRADKRLQRASSRIQEARRRKAAEADGESPRLLIADSEPDFCATAERALNGAFVIRTAKSVAELLVHILRWKPTGVLLSPRLPGLDLDVLQQRVETLAGSDVPKFYRLDEPGTRGKASTTEPPYIAAVSKSFVAATLLGDVSQLVLGLPKSADGLREWAGFLEEELTTALFQALGMMTSVEPEPDDQPDEAWKPDLYGRLGVSADDDRFSLNVGVDTASKLTMKLAEAMLGGEADEESAVDAFKEMLNIVAGRLRNACVEKKIAVSMQLPEASTQEPPETPNRAFTIEKRFIWNGDCRFRIFLEAAMLDDAAPAEDPSPEPVPAQAAGD